MILQRITLPLPVSVNQLYNGGSGQKRFPSKKYKAWLASCPPVKANGLSNVILHYHYFFPDNRNRDSENYVKAASDFLVKAGVICDDCWQCVRELHITTGGIDKACPRLEIRIETYNG
jgi:Holliday junction resolvase RusA-like endonuclease